MEELVRVRLGADDVGQRDEGRRLAQFPQRLDRAGKQLELGGGKSSRGKSDGAMPSALHTRSTTASLISGSGVQEIAHHPAGLCRAEG